MENYSLSDVAAVTRGNMDGFGDGNGWWIILILLFALGGNGFGYGRDGFAGRVATVEDVNNSANFTRLEGQVRFNENLIQNGFSGIEFIQNHLKELHRAIQDGANCHGYMLWTFIDCWSWLNAYKNRYGLVELDLETQEKKKKKSGYWFKELSENNGF